MTHIHCCQQQASESYPCTQVLQSNSQQIDNTKLEIKKDTPLCSLHYTWYIECFIKFIHKVTQVNLKIEANLICPLTTACK